MLWSGTLADGWCAWHHPAIIACRGRDRCHAVNSLGKRCGELALETPAFRSLHCWYHLSATERQALVRAIHHPELPKITPSRPGSAMRHAEIQQILRSSSVGDLLLLDGTFRELGWPRSLVIARVRLPASSSAPARVEFVARLCQTCDEWHATDVADQSIPDVSCAYFAIGPPSAAQRGVVGSDLSLQSLHTLP